MSRRGVGPPKFSAANSHQLNDQYMQNFEEGLARMGLGGGAPGAPSNARAIRGGRASRRPDGGVGVLTEGMKPLFVLESISSKWFDGPSDPAGFPIAVSERPLLCGSIFGTEAVFASADHSLYAIDVASGKVARQLYTKQCGHTEWVTAVCHTIDGAVVSGGMDNKICVWAPRSTRCVDLVGHSGSISMLRAGSATSVAVSSSYDKTLKIWDTAKKRELSTLSGHTAPVLDFAWTANTHGTDGVMIVSGSRDGMVIVWDVSSGDASRKLKGHKGHVTAVTAFTEDPSMPPSGSIFLTGAQDGHVRVWDGRSSHALVAKIESHVAEGGTGAVSFIRCANGGVCTGGADKTIQVLDPRASFAIRDTFSHHRDFIYSMEVVDTGKQSILVSGAGDGSVLLHDVNTGKCLYGLGANKNAVRSILATPQDLVVAGDDGEVMLYAF
eukprot:Rmarinus@m.6999